MKTSLQQIADSRATLEKEERRANTAPEREYYREPRMNHRWCFIYENLDLPRDA